MTDAEINRRKAAEIVRDAGGMITGRTRLQKIGYLLFLAGYEDWFSFEYRQFGPYSEALAEGIQMARAFGLIEEEERAMKSGGFYSIYRAIGALDGSNDGGRTAFAKTAAEISAIELELAATAAYFYTVEDSGDPWGETERRKPEKAANGRLEKAKASYRRLQEMATPRALPVIS